MIKRHIIKISGDSMSPALVNGDYAVIKKPRAFSPGRIYVVQHSDLGLIVKRLKCIENSRYIFEGDNTASTPSSLIAPVEAERIKGQVIFVIGKSGLRRP